MDFQKYQQIIISQLLRRNPYKIQEKISTEYFMKGEIIINRISWIDPDSIHISIKTDLSLYSHDEYNSISLISLYLEKKFMVLLFGERLYQYYNFNVMYIVYDSIDFFKLVNGQRAF